MKLIEVNKKVKKLVKKAKVIFKIYDVIYWETNNYKTYCLLSQ